MMTFRRVAVHAFAEPFRPFRIRTVGGNSIDVRHPEMIHVGRTEVTVSSWLEDPPWNARVSIADIDSIEGIGTEVEPLQQEAGLTSRVILELLEAEPFRPFRIRTESGREYDVRSRRAIRVGVESVIVYEFKADDERVFERCKFLGLSAIESIEHLDVPVVHEADEN